MLKAVFHQRKEEQRSNRLLVVINLNIEANLVALRKPNLL
jgi:hypothetical protein